MLVVVNTVSFLVRLLDRLHAQDPRRPRFFAYLSMFTFAMLALVTSDNFLQLSSAGRVSGLLAIC